MSENINAGTTGVRAGFAFDVAKLDLWMRENVEDYRGPLTVEQFRGGQSNPTYLLTTPDRRYVLRRKPPGATASGAHAVDREARVQSALAGSGVPVARIHGLCTDDNVIGSWFYVMDHVQGRIIWDARLPDVDRAERPAYFDAMNATIAALHQIDFAAIGLADYGKAGGYLARQISRWTRQYRTDEAAGRNDDLERLIEWLPANIPPGDESSISHGDFRIDNMVFHPSEPRILAVLDWELSTIGHPVADFAYHAMMYRMPPLMITGLAGTDFAAENIPTESEYVAAYCRRTGRDGIPDLDFYFAFNLFRLAAIVHGIKGRIISGTAASAHAQTLVESLPLLARLAWETAERAGG